MGRGQFDAGVNGLKVKQIRKEALFVEWESQAWQLILQLMRNWES